ncbi:MAG TPA: molybdopterin-dependent oxidoreductase, partial [Acetobacteraceae bacterium]|nr:molybdopterin-dependent oxidoreductase [Acetobacteraceae bacterium]
AASMHAVTCLPTVTGKWQHEGAGALWSYRSIQKWDKTLIEGLDAVDPSTRILDMSRLASILNGDRVALRDGPPVQAMLIQNSNPATVAPDTHRVRRGLLRDDLFVAVHEQFMTETAQLADIVLPATMFMEHDDLYQAGGHSHIQVGAKLVDPPGECRPNHAVIQGLASRLGAEHRGFAMTEMEIIDETLRVAGWPDAKTVLERHWIDIAPPFAEAHFHEGFPQPDRRFHFAPDWRALGADWARLPTLPDYMPATDEATPDRPFRMVTAPARQFLNTTFTETPTSRQREARPTVLVHPADAARAGIIDGGRVRLGNARGEVVLHARLFDGMQQGVIVAESVWPNAAFEGGIGINALTSDDPAPPAGGAVFHDTAVWLRAEAAALPLAAE